MLFKRMLLLFICSCSLYASSESASYESDYDLEFYKYQQETLNYNDYKGDVLLADFRSHFNNPDRLVKMLTGRLHELLEIDREKFTFYNDELEYMSKKDEVVVNVESTQKPFSSNDLYETLASSLSRYQIETGESVTVGQCHKWSKKFQDETPFSKVKVMGKLLAALSMGVSSQYLRTGKEEGLRDWILTKDDRSVTLDEIFLKSLYLNDGNTYLSSLTIENLLSRYWRARDREDLKIIRKLSSITSILNENGDIFGSWYHLWGMVTYGMCYGGVKSFIIGSLETIGSHFSYWFVPEPGQDHINSISGPVGNKLVKAIKKGKDLKDYKNKVKIPTDVFGSLHAEYKSGRLDITSLKETLSPCHLMIHTFDKKGARIDDEIYFYKTFKKGEVKSFDIEKEEAISKIQVTFDKCFPRGV